ncbi:MAG: transcription termination/antitermination protein NusA [Synergistaceae bacterium]|nr:transcription termination/antitermination protein NusA [Synergistaceae bacterium]
MRLGRDFIAALDTLSETRGLDTAVIISALEAALLSAYSKFHPGDQKTEIHIDHDTGEMTVSELRTVVEGTAKAGTEITLNDAKALDPSAELGRIIRIELNPEDFGRIAAQTARQVITQRLRDETMKAEVSAFADKVGDMVSGTIYKTEGDNVIVRLSDKAEAVLPKRERIPGEKYNYGDTMKFYVLEVKDKARGPRIMLSRTHPGLLKKLLELEVPEIQQGIVEIRNIVRDGGTRAKVSLVSLDPNVDPVGACVGNGGARIKAISSALRGEKIDVIVFSQDPLTYIKNALSPAQTAKIEPVLDNERAVTVYVYPDQLSLAIGKSGQNVRLAAKLTGWKIDITPVEPERMPTLKDIFSDVFHEKN